MNYFQSARAHFLACHQHPINQAIHHLTNFLAFIAIAVLFYDWRISLLLLLIPQPIVWAGHAVFEKNQPAFVQFPGITIVVSLLWSLEHLFGLRDLWQAWQRSRLSH